MVDFEKAKRHHRIPPRPLRLGCAAPFELSDFEFVSDFGFRISGLIKSLFLPIAAALLTLASASYAQQQNSPHIGYVYPAGGRQGAAFEVEVGGQFLDGVTNVYVCGAGVQATVLEDLKPPTPKQLGELREKAKELQDKRQAVLRSRRLGATPGSTNYVVWTAEDEKMALEIRKKMLAFQGKKPANPAIAETVVLRVAMDPDAEPGERELRLGTPAGLSNPLVFRIGDLPEFRAKEPLPSDEPLRGKDLKARNEPKATPRSEMNITLPALVNGQILPGGVDRYRFHARQGQHLVVTASARELIPYLADAVPGWFQATLTLYDGKGKELAYDDHYQFHPDPVIHYEVPADGEYAVEIRDSIYRGREDFVYRIAIGELPFVTSIFPLGGPAGAQTTVELKGWNLPVTNLMLNNADREQGIYPFTVHKDKFVSNRVPFAVDTLPECLEREPNNSPENAQPVMLPIIINGRIDQPGDWDVFRFEGRAGDELVAEVYARRLDSPLDSVLKLTDAAGHQLAYNDDYEDKGSGLNTHHADSYLSLTLPADGVYYLHLGDAQHQGGPEFAYRLRLSAPRPDFALRIVPSTINARAGMNVPLTVYALRKDGFTNDITLALNDAPDGFTLSGAQVPAGQSQVRLTLRAPPDCRDGAYQPFHGRPRHDPGT